MPTIKERLQALEQEHTDLKKTIELQTIAIGALGNKAALEKLNEKYDKIFEALMTQDRFTNEQLAELRTQQIETDGKTAGLQTEMCQRFNEQGNKIADMATKEDMNAMENRILQTFQQVITTIRTQRPQSE
jgi:Na+-transporting NADH:ubiquinone oxidoreductase subunit NqrA